MRTIGTFDAKTHLSQLLKEVEKGEIFAITKHGRVIALLTPADETKSQLAAIEAIKLNRKGVTLGKKLTLKNMIKEGRK